jgi:SpoVK/Ycf46/Vps4 family AAA+-type ATPase
MEAVRSIIFSESTEGRQIRGIWHSSLPAAWGSPTGSTVLLYGPPGTGKTLTALFLASELRVPLIKIDAARVLSCWVGESEQQVRRIFDDYSNIQQEMGISPVLLFNEADQLLGSRDAGHNSVDRMNNNMQNLFLEGLERFSGIMVATSNRRDLLDEAFSRRFTYKLELPTPDRNLRFELWKSHLPLERLAEDVDIGQLADLGLSGGEIRLVIERTVRLLAYRGITTIDSKILMDIAKEELTSRMKRNGSSGKIGFGAVTS